MSVKGARGTKPPRRVLPQGTAFVALLVLVAIAWTVLWRFAAGESEKTVAAWIEREKSFGRIWSCPDRSIGGFPFGIEIICAKPHFDGLIFGRHFSGGLGGFRAMAMVFHPTAVTTRLGSPFAVLSDDGQTNVELAWDGLNVVLTGTPQGLWHVDIGGKNLVWHGTVKDVGAVGGSAGRLSAEAAERPDQADRAYDFNVTVSAATLPDIDRFLDASVPANIEARGTVTQASFDPGRTLPENMDAWRAAGGRLDLAEASLAHGDTNFSAHGSLSIDDLHRVQGKLDTESRGFEPVLTRLGVNPTLVTAGALLSSILSGGSPGNADTPPDKLAVPVGFDSGRLTIGPVRTSIELPPLY
jgi:hypothetical protein